MPYLRVRLATASHTPATTAKVAQALTQLVVTKLGKNAAAAAVDIRYRDPASWFIGGQALTATHQSSFFVEVKVTSGTNTRADKAAFVQAVFAAMQRLLGPIAATSYVVVTDVPGSDWGYGGKTQSFRYETGQ
ncbi:tautomerase family protein [Lacticaseibacillus parakribbianus]|uniref:tautomerase family protein n=1 Tax=Lacticaseibacillus parakribbianus TaxID=2970927 RepID=UPI0021CB6550|nr:tautomerase family protein [Lacticaseibacillus parakribbianus]